MFDCRPPGAAECVVGVVSEQCGEEIAGYARSLISKVLEQLHCTKRQRQYNATRLNAFNRLHGWKVIF